MNYTGLFQDSKTGVIKIEFIVGGKLLGGGSGFIVNGMLITNHHVFLGCHFDLEKTQVKLTRHCGNKYDRALMSGTEFSQANISSSEESKEDYTILEIEKFPKKISNFFEGYQFSLESCDKVCEGLPIAFIGYPFNKQNVTGAFPFCGS